MLGSTGRQPERWPRDPQLEAGRQGRSCGRQVLERRRPHALRAAGVLAARRELSLRAKTQRSRSQPGTATGRSQRRRSRRPTFIQS